MAVQNTSFLYEKLNNLREFDRISEIPARIEENLNSKYELRPYQRESIENFITWHESANRPYPLQNLFHMATGSGKTLIMAALIEYLYKKGYRNFLFFVNTSNIVLKTEENFLNQASAKYLFADEIIIDGERVPVRKVTNFQDSSSDAINICFTTTQKLHMDMNLPKENAVTIDDFVNQKTVLISDEAHHLNVETKKRLKKEEEESKHSWEYSVKRILGANKDNILLEFTATADLGNPKILAEYENKIIYDYPLSKFRADGYSKEIKTLRSDISIMDRALQAIVLSQYRLKIFEDHKLSVKPVVLFKSENIKKSAENMEEFERIVASLTGTELERISGLTEDETMKKAWQYFTDNGISFDQLAQELKEAFSPEHCISANNDKDATTNQILLNSLEDQDNPYRAVFEVRKLDEGWDVLNLFDIVRMYETRQSGKKKVSPATVSEAQLIGRGARYFPFKVEDDQEMYKRKYDHDLDNPLRICEELYYHCQNDSRYITELNQALKDIGLDQDTAVTQTYKIKDSFKSDSLYKSGLVFSNDRIVKTRNDVFGLLPSVRKRIYNYHTASGSSGEDTVFEDETASIEAKTDMEKTVKTFSEIARQNYNIVHKALRQFGVFKFNILKGYFPNLKSTREFIESGEYLGDISLEIYSPEKNPDNQTLYNACVDALSKISESISSIEETYEGSREFKARYIHEVFRDKTCNYAEPHDGGIGISQNDSSVPPEWKMDLSKEDWFVFEDNFGTSEEKAFVSYFKDYVESLKEKYDKVYLIRNERQLKLYSFEGGERFEPDYLLFLHKPSSTGYEQIQVFIEPKGTHLLEKDQWKEDFLLELENNAVPVITFKDDNDYKIWGFHFFNQDNRMPEFNDDFSRL